MIARPNRRAESLVGKHFGRALVISISANGTGVKNRTYLCYCSCGLEFIATDHSLRYGQTNSCGCLQKERASQASKTHGMSGSQVYQAWSRMIARCHNQSDTNYYKYGARSIRVCERWHVFENFIADMGPRPRGHSIERINNDGPYTPANCRWATSREQAQNRRNSRLLTVAGETKPIIEWARLTGVNYSTILWRLKNNQTPEQALSR